MRDLVSSAEDLDHYASALQSVVAALGLLAAGFWAYFKFIRDPNNRPRLDLTIEADEIWTGGLRTIVAKSSVKNVGISRVQLFQTGSGVRLSTATTNPDPYEEFDWGVDRAFAVFDDYEWIDIGQTIHEELVIPIPKDQRRPLLLELRIVSRRGKSKHNLANITHVVVTLQDHETERPA